jgi:hypothetical protein
MTTSTWNGSDADWYTNNGGDWTPAGDPGPSSAVVINSGEPELLSGDPAISVASISITGGLLAIQDPGVTQAVSGNVTVSGSGSLQLDGNNIGGAGGSSMTIGGTLTNTSTNGNAISIGNGNITSADTVTVNGSGGLTSTGQIDIEGSATAQATLNIANAAAGFGTASTETGNLYLQGDALLEFKSGEISTIDGGVQLSGANARVADAGSTTTNSALTGLATVAGNFWLQNGATVSPTGNVSITGSGTIQLDGNNEGGGGGSSLTIGGSLTNSSSNGNALSIGNGNITSADTLTVNGSGGLSSTGQIDIEGSATVQATLNVADAAAGFGTASTETGNLYLQGDSLLEFKSGEISTVDGGVQLNGASAYVADAGSTTSNSALTGLTTVAGNFWLQNGASVSPTGNVSITGNGTIQLDGNNEGGVGGSSLTIGGTLTNSSSNGNALSIGNGNITAADTLTVNGSSGLTSTGQIDIEGSATVQATLDVANAAAGFGTASTETGNLYLQGDALLEFKSGEISTIDGVVQLNGANARIADATSTSSNSALTGLTTVAGDFWLQNGATVSPTGNVSITGNGTIQLDGNNEGGVGGSSLTIKGTLTNSSSNGNALSIGNGNITSADTLTVNGKGGLTNTGQIDIEGSTTVQATLDIADHAAGFGTTGVETGNVYLSGDALLEFKSGSIKTIDGDLELDGKNARVASGTKLTTNSALTGLATVAGNFWLENGATVSPTGNVSVTGNGTIELDGNNIGGSGGTKLTITGTLTNSSSNGNGIDIGNGNITSADTLTVKGTGGLSNGSSSEINVVGSATVLATLDVSGDAAGFGTTGVETGTVFLQNDALLEFESGEIATVDGELYLDGAKARVADAGATTTNSALTGLATVSGNFWLNNGATVSPTGNVSVTGNGTVELDGNNIGGVGGTSLTIGGSLTNSSTNGNGVDVGNGNITSADTLTVKGTGGLSNTGEINITGGSASATATLDVTDTATSSGTIDINAFGKLKAATVDVTGGSVVINASGNLTATTTNVSGGSVVINASGDLTATTTNVTGGTVEGVGTVTGALNDTGGAVVGGTLNSTTGTLNVDGAYEQSGSGVLQTDINTGDSQQSSIIAVTGTPGTPSTAGSVNLEGGTLLIDAQTSLALNTPYTVMTFGAGDLYGEFAQVETEGSLGSFTGNGDSVTVGNGDTLEVLYNEAAGDIQVELVKTRSSTTYDWDIGSGTWNASSGADWNPPNNGTTPSQTSNVEIGTGGGGTVTLAADQTIASLSIINGYTLSGATRSITTVGNASVASGAVLSIDNMNVGGTFADSGSATFAGVLTMISGAVFTLTGGTLSGGINGTGTFETTSGGSGTLDNVTIYKGTTYTTTDSNVATDVTGTIGGQGTLQVDGGADANGYLVLTGATTLSGGGALSLTTATGGGQAFVEGNGETLTNASDVIAGTGEIGNGSLALINGGTIDANSSAGTGVLILNNSGATTNADGTTGGLMEATNGGTLDIDGITIDDDKGKITASGGTVELVSGAVVEGGTLTSSNGGTLETGSGQTATLIGTKKDGAVTISAGSTYTTTDTNSATDILGTITDKGTISVSGGNDANGYLVLTAATTLGGGGTVSLTTGPGGGEAFIEGNSETLTTSDTIEGSGEIGNGSLTLINSGTIDANLPSTQTNTGTLILNGSGGITNAKGATAGLMEATSGGTLQINSITVNNDTAAITANGGFVVVNSSTIQGGTLNELGGGTMETASSENATLDGSTHGALTISAGSTYTTTDSNSTTDILGTIIDKGTISVSGGNDANGALNLTGATTLNGGGTVALTTATGGGQAFVSGNSETLTNSDVIEGTGEIGNGSLAVINRSTIDANSSAGTGTLILNGSGGVTNSDLLEATHGGTLQINSITVNNDTAAITANGGVVVVNSSTIQGGTLNESGGGTMETASDENATLDGSTHGALTLSAGSTYATTDSNSTTEILGTITDDGTLQVGGGNDANGALNLTANVTLNGGGTVSLTTATGGGEAFVEGNGETLTNSDTIEGTGEIGNGSLAIINGGTIDANSSAGTGALILNGSGGITNANGATAGLIEATSGGTLQINSITVNNDTAAITANGGAVQMNSATIEGGTLNVLGGGTMGTTSSTVTLDGSTEGALTISSGSTYTASNGTTTDILGTITDKGTISVSGGDDNNGYLVLTGKATLNGGGTVVLTTATGGGNAFLEGNGETLTNSDVIEGTGVIGNGSLTLTSSGTIDANSSAGTGTLTVNGSGAVTNTGVFEATAGGYLDVADALSGAGALKIGANSTVELGGATNENATFLSATVATVLIDNATTAGEYTGVLNSFAKGDILELGSTNATSATPTSFNGTDTTVTVDLSSGGPLTYSLAGNYTGDTFTVGHSGSNSLIEIATDPVFDEAASLLGGHTASPFVESTGVFGGSSTPAQPNLVASLHAHS